MDAEQRILKLLDDRGSDGALQSEIGEILNLSKSTVSEVLSKLEEEGKITKRLVSGKSYRVWLVKHAPFAIEGVVRVGILRASEYPKVVTAARKVGGIVKVYDSALELTKSLVSGKVDVAASPMVTQLFFGVLMKNIKIFRIVAMNGSGVVYGGGKDWFGCSEFSTMELNLRKFLAAKGEKLKIRYFASPEEMLKSLSELRGIAIWEPYFSAVEGEKEEFREVLGDFVCCSLAANTGFLEVNGELFDDFLSKFDSARVSRSSAEELAALIGFDVDVVYRSFSSYEFEVEQERPKALEKLILGSIDEIFEF
ncbi:MAG: winged helix-turn-helix transcriptional regulator [Archaeoglobaceae archaeon]